MIPSQLKIVHEPKLQNATLLLALTGWMDGGSVSTGTVRQIMGRREVKQVARIDPDDFYIYNVPGTMEVAALFRPNTKYEEGVVTQLEMPANIFWADESANLLFFVGKEPNLRWQKFADCIFHLAGTMSISRIVFVGSFGGSVPHTREPRMYGAVSHPSLKPLLKEYNVTPSDYEGPGSFATLLLAEAQRHGVEMVSLVAEIPGYLQGDNPRSIEAVTRRLSKMIHQPLDLDSLREASNSWEAEVSAVVEKDEELAATIRKLEEEYDDALIQSDSA